MAELPPLSLYIHFPWCVKKCPYCDFNSHESGPKLPEDQYVKKLLSDLDHQKDPIAGRRIETVFMGGGTPSLFSGESIIQLLNCLRERVQLADGAEITLESNPGLRDKANLRGYFSAGVNRLSIGVQSFQDQYLQKLGRIHTGDQAKEVIRAARDYGFSNINIDLMHGLPGQNHRDALSDLKMAIKLKPTHISWYQLTIEPNTLFYKKPPILPKEDLLWSIQQAGHELLESSGYKQYEVSAYALAGYECMHNLNYWNFGDYVGIGAGAHGKLTDTRGSVSRSIGKRIPNEYIASDKSIASHKVSEKDLISEFLINVLRLKKGFKQSLFTQRTGLPESQLESFIENATQKGLLEQGDKIRATEKGYQHLNELLLMVI